jgi:hypothetical protein
MLRALLRYPPTVKSTWYNPVINPTLIGGCVSKRGPDVEEVDRGFTTPCHIWRKSLNDGKPIRYRGNKKVYVAKERYTERFGPIPKTMRLIKACGHTLCVNPDHMRPMTYSDSGVELWNQGKDVEKRIPELARFPPGRGCTYVVKAEGTGMVKIGRTTDLKRRLATLQYGCPVPLTLLAVVDGEESERDLHTTFGHLRRHGEWFEETGSLLETVKNHAGSRGQNRLSRRPTLTELGYIWTESSVPMEVQEEIRSLYPPRPYTRQQLAEKFGVTIAQVNRIIDYK